MWSGECAAREDDCWDQYVVTQTSSSSLSDRAGCGLYGCVEYDEAHECQCNQGCTQHGNCCFDYERSCVNGLRA